MLWSTERAKHFLDKYEGSELRKLLVDKRIEILKDSVITVTAEDGYTAEFTGAEILENGKVYVALSQNGEMIEDRESVQGIRIIVFW